MIQYFNHLWTEGTLLRALAAVPECCCAQQDFKKELALERKCLMLQPNIDSMPGQAYISGQKQPCWVQTQAGICLAHICHWHHCTAFATCMPACPSLLFLWIGLNISEMLSQSLAHSQLF
jgi:hypothetical protein